MRDSRAHECFFEPTAHEVVAIEDGDFIPPRAFRVAELNLDRNASGLGRGIAESDDLDRRAKFFFCEKGLAQAFAVPGDDRVGGGKDMAG
jgi:hypothetical protein